MRKRGRKKKGHARGLRRRYGRSAIPVQVHGQLFMEVETPAEAVAEAEREIHEELVEAHEAQEIASERPIDLELAPFAMRGEELTELGVGLGHARRRYRR